MNRIERICFVFTITESENVRLAFIWVISKGMLKDHKSLVKCFLSDEIEVIDDKAFKGCSAMKKPWIPKIIKPISETSFDNPEWRNMI